MPVTIHWKCIEDFDDEKWGWSRCLYAYVDPKTGEIYYIGKADGSASTVRARFMAQDKRRVFGVIVDERGLLRDDLAIVVGVVACPGPLTTELLADIESLLIWSISPIGNHRNIFSRAYCRPGMIVRCTGDWTHSTSTFYDDGPPILAVVHLGPS